MREIEFKAKMVDGGVWVYGNLCDWIADMDRD